MASLSLDTWLARLQQLHPQAIDMGLERVAAVRDRLCIKPDFPVILVGGTNGKGSTCAMLEAIYQSAGYKVGLYTSPHLLRYNERVRVNDCEVRDSELVAAFEKIDAARGDISLTYFEFGTVAAYLIFNEHTVDVGIMEVGLGGRLDAVNVFEPDCSIVVSVAIDHIDYLGVSREAIGLEKAGIFRGGRPAICADEDPPASLLEYANDIKADLYLAGRDFGHKRAGSDWQFWNDAGKKAGLPFPGLRGGIQLNNASAALTCVHAMRARLPVDMGAVRTGLLDAHLPGRFQVIPGLPLIILDVAHNAAAAQSLSANLKAIPCSGRTIAIFGVLADKDIAQITAALSQCIDEWFVCGLSSPRTASAEQIRQILTRTAATVSVTVCDRVANAYAAARKTAHENDRIIVFGSFYTVSEALETMSKR